MRKAELVAKLASDLRNEQERARELQRLLDVARINVHRLMGGLEALSLVDEEQDPNPAADDEDSQTG